MPEGQTDSILANEFATFFLEKIENIWDKFTGIEEFKPATNEQATPLKTFSPLSCNKIQKQHTQHEQQDLQTGPHSY